MLIDETYLEQQFGIKPHRKRAVNKTHDARKAHANTLDGSGEVNAAQKAFKKIERLVAVRDRSVSEVTKRLKQDDFSSAVIDEAIDRALRCNYLDDHRFADILIRSRLSAGRGVEGIKRELQDHQIDLVSCEALFDEYQALYPSEFTRALDALMKKPPRAKNKQQAAFSKLMRMGYSSAIAAAAARQWAETA